LAGRGVLLGIPPVPNNKPFIINPFQVMLT